MFLGLAVTILLAILAIILVVKAVKAIFRALTGGKKEAQDNEPKADKKSKKEPKESESESETLEKTEGAELEPVSEDLKSRYALSQFEGITETEWTEAASVELNPDVVESRCVQQSSITHLEFNNRELAGDEFYGFNIHVEMDKKMTLTYNGQAVASITRIDVTATAIINGEEVTGTEPGYRINTFPPKLTPGMVPSDVEKMLSAADHILACNGDPEKAAEAMMAEFCAPGNVARLKNSIDGKIQQREAQTKKSLEQKQSTGKQKQGPKVS